MVALVKTRGAVSPGAFEADVAVPVAGVCEYKASFTESAFFEMA
jgi:hypothetical protein